MSNLDVQINDANYDDGVSLSRELRGLKNDRIMTERSIKSQQEVWVNLLNGGLGKDMTEVLEGKRKVTLPLSIRLKYKWNNFVNKLLKLV